MKLITNLFTYFREAIAELKKVVWPTKKQTINYTIIVVLLSIGVAIFFAVLDNIFNLGIGKII